jgi:hypothetical protein
MSRHVVTLNAGSSSIKFALFELDGGDIDSKSLERDAGGKPASAFPHPALETKTATCVRLVEGTRQRIDLSFQLRNFFLQIIDPAFIPLDQHPNAGVNKRCHRRLAVDHGCQDRADDADHGTKSPGA